MVRAELVLNLTKNDKFIIFDVKFSEFVNFCTFVFAQIFFLSRFSYFDWRMQRMGFVGRLECIVRLGPKL